MVPGAVATVAQPLAPSPLRLGTAAGRWVVLATVLGSGIAALDATVVNVALPTIGRDLDAGLTSLQWTINAYTLTLAGFLLLGGALGDRYGRRRLFVIGVVWFAAASLLCGIAPNAPFLIAARAVQGVGAALLTPGSLAILEASFHPDDRGAAIGAWSGLGGVTTAIGPFLGGWLIDAVSWRLIFLINLPLSAAVVWIAARHVPESRNPRAGRGVDVPGAILAALGLAGVTYGLTEGGFRGWGSGDVLVTLFAGVVALAAFLIVQARRRDPMLPLDIFRSRQFSAANAVTLVVYAALGGALFLIPSTLQVVLGFTPLEAGTALIPLTVVMLLFSARSGRLAARIGPRLPMSLGPIVAGVGLILLVRLDPGGSYWADVLPGVLVLAAGLALTVAPLTATVLAAASAERAGVASAVNNDVARIGGLLAVAVLPTAAGIASSDYGRPGALAEGFQRAMVISGILCVIGGLVAWATIRRAGAPFEGVHCSLDAPPLRGPSTEPT
jgi:EmrB/QacA subfamily drug resistance transporter